MIKEFKPWFYKGKPIYSTKDMPENSYGFIYEITYLPTGQKYLGKKNVYHEKNKKLGKKELIKIREERKSKGLRGRAPTKKKITFESDWKTYHGSHKKVMELVKQEGPEQFNREILMFVKDKKMLTYYETKFLFLYEVIENNDTYFNTNISGHFYSKDFKNPENSMEI